MCSRLRNSIMHLPEVQFVGTFMRNHQVCPSHTASPSDITLEHSTTYLFRCALGSCAHWPSARDLVRSVCPPHPGRRLLLTQVSRPLLSLSHCAGALPTLLHHLLPGPGAWYVLLLSVLCLCSLHVRKLSSEGVMRWFLQGTAAVPAFMPFSCCIVIAFLCIAELFLASLQGWAERGEKKTRVL